MAVESKKSDPSDGMMSFAYAFVRLHSRLQDGQHVATVTVDPAGDAMLVSVVGRDCKGWRSRFTEVQVARLKASAYTQIEIAWAPFFELLQRAFVDRSLEFNAEAGTLKVQLKHERQTDALPVPGFSVSMHVDLQPVAEAGAVVNDVVTGMLAFLSMRNGERREMDRVEEICRQEERLKEETSTVMSETAVLDNALAAYQRLGESAKGEVAVLEGQLGVNSLDIDSAGKIDPSLVLYGVPPIDGHPVRDYVSQLKPDVVLLRTAVDMFTKGISIQSPKGPLPEGTPRDGKYSPRSDGDGPETPTPADEAADGGHETTGNKSRRNPSYQRHANLTGTTDGEVPPLTTENQEAVLDLLRHMDDWGLNVEELEKKMRGCGDGKAGAVALLGFIGFHRLGLLEKFSMVESALWAWLCAAEASYREVPFHCAAHAADVIHALLFFLLAADGARRIRASDADLLALLVAGVCIDIGHPGLTNDFLRAEGTSMAARTFVAQPILESYHASQAFALLRVPGCDFLEAMAPAKVSALHAQVANFLLVTDLGRHEAAVAALTRAQAKSPGELPAEEAPIALGVLLKAADIAFSAKAQTFKNAADALTAELQMQAVKERSLNLFVSADDSKPGSAAESAVTPDGRRRTLLALVNFVTTPVFAAVSELLPLARGAGAQVAEVKRQLLTG